MGLFLTLFTKYSRTPHKSNPDGTRPWSEHKKVWLSKEQKKPFTRTVVQTSTSILVEKHIYKKKHGIDFSYCHTRKRKKLIIWIRWNSFKLNFQLLD